MTLPFLLDYTLEALYFDLNGLVFFFALVRLSTPHTYFTCKTPAGNGIHEHSLHSLHGQKKLLPRTLDLAILTWRRRGKYGRFPDQCKSVHAITSA